MKFGSDIDHTRAVFGTAWNILQCKSTGSGKLWEKNTNYMSENNISTLYFNTKNHIYIHVYFCEGWEHVGVVDLVYIDTCIKKERPQISVIKLNKFDSSNA